MKQKLAVARALVHEPRLIFLDEPTSGLDPVAAAALREDLARLASDTQVTVFLTTHNLSEAERLCDLVAVIRSGKLLAIGRPDELQQRTNTTQVEIFGSGFQPNLLAQVRDHASVKALLQKNNHIVLEMRPKTEVAPVLNLLVAGGAQIEEVRKNRASLEDIFLELVKEEQQD